MLCLCISRLLSLKMMMREVLHHRSNKNVSKAVFYHQMLVVKQFTFDAFILYLCLPTWSKVTILLQKKRKILENKDNQFKCTPRHWLCAGSCFVRYTVNIFPTTEETWVKSTAVCISTANQSDMGRALQRFAMYLVWQHVLWDNLASLSCTFHYHWWTIISTTDRSQKVHFHSHGHRIHPHMFSITVLAHVALQRLQVILIKFIT